MKRNEIGLINLDPIVGSEMSKTRPAVIINDNSLGILPLKIIVPLTDWKNDYSSAVWMVNLAPNSTNNLKKTSAIDCFQIRSLSEKRIIKKIGVISDAKMEEVEVALSKILNIK